MEAKFSLLPKKKIWIWGVSFMSMLFAFVSFEVGLRLFSEPPQLVDIRALQNPNRKGEVSEKTQGIRLYLTTETGRRMRPNTIATVSNHSLSKKNVIVETNSLGYRNRELGDKQRKRILFLGDSITLADYVDEHDTIVRMVETLSENLSEPVETVNAGIGGVGAQTYLYILMETGLSIKPDLVIVDLYLNDFQSSQTIKLFHPPKVLQNSWAANWLFHSFSKRYTNLTRIGEPWEDNIPRVPESDLRAWRKKVECCFPELEPSGEQASRFQERVLVSMPDWGGAWSEGAWQRVSEVLFKMKDLLREAHVPMVLVIFPVSYQVDEGAVYDFPQRRAKELARKLNVPILDILPSLREQARRSSEKLFYDHCHYTPLGNQLIAGFILDFLVQTGFVSRKRDADREIEGRMGFRG